MSETLSNNKRIARNTLFLYGRMLLSMLISLYTARVVLNTLGASDFGLFNVVGGVIAVFAVLKALIATGTQRFLTFEMGKGADNKRLAAVFSTSLSAFLMIGGVILLLGETIGLWFVNTYLSIPEGREIAANVVYQVSILSMLTSSVNVPYTAAIMSHERMDIYGYVGIGEPFLKLVLVVILPFLPFDKLISYALITFFILLLTTIVYVIACNKLFEECKFRIKVDKPLFKSMLGFTMWNMLESISNMLNQQGLDILINIFFGTTINASRAVANQVKHSVHGFASNFLIAMFPQITKTYAAKQYNEYYGLMIRGAKFSYMILAVLIIPIILNIDYILFLWLKNPPEYAAIFCALVLISLIVSMVSETLFTGIQATGNIKKYQIWTSSITLLNIPICYLLFKTGFPAYVAFMISIFMSSVLVVCRLLFISRLTDFPAKRYLKTILLDCFAVTIIAFIPLYWINTIIKQNVFDLIWVSFVAVIWTGFLFLLFSVTKEERRIIFEMIKNILLKRENK